MAAEAVCEIAAFVASRQTADGGFCGRSPASDIYFSHFALATLTALEAHGDWAERARPFAARHAAALPADLPHLVATLRVHLLLALGQRGAGPGAAAAARWLPASGRALAANQLLGDERATRFRQALDEAALADAYSTFLLLQAREDLGLAWPDPESTVARLLAAQTTAGGFAADARQAAETTTVAAAAVIVLTRLGGRVPAGALAWLAAQQTPTGGFRATAGAPLPDLLSTAAALMALDLAGHAPTAKQRAAHAAFIEGLWRDSGGFAGHPLDTEADVEYTFYALLAMGLLDAHDG